MITQVTVSRGWFTIGAAVFFVCFGLLVAMSYLVQVVIWRRQRADSNAGAAGKNDPV
jgi:hypothetical protein